MSISKRAKKIAAVSLSVLLAVMIVVPLISNIALAADMTVSLSDPTASGINESTRTVLYNTDSTGSAYNLYLDGNEFKIDYTPNDTSVGEWLTQLRAAYYKSFSKKLYGEQRNSYLNYLDYGHDANAEVSSEQVLIESADKAYMYSGNYYYITSNVWNTGTLYNPATGEAYEKTSAEKAYKYLDVQLVDGKYQPILTNEPQEWRIIGKDNANNNVNYSFLYVDDNGSENMALTLIEDVPSEEIFQEYSFTVTGLDTNAISSAKVNLYQVDGTKLNSLTVQSDSTGSDAYAVMSITDNVLTLTVTDETVTGILLNITCAENSVTLNREKDELSSSYQVQSDGTLLATGETVVTSITQPIEGAETTYELTLTEWTGTPTEGQLFSSDRNVNVSDRMGYSVVHLHSALYTAKYLSASGIKNITSGQIIEGVTGIENAPRDVTAGNYSNNHSYNWYFTYADSPYTPFPEVKYTWASSNPEIADINDAGYVRIYQPGSVRFTCTASVDTGLTAIVQVEIGPSPLLEKEFYVDYQFTEGVTKASPLTDTEDNVNFPGEDEPGSVTIDKSADTDSTDYDDNGVANVRLEAESLVASEPVDVILVIDASRSMTDFWSEDYDLVFCSGTRTETYINNGKTITDATYTGSRDITYYVEDGALFDASNNPISNTYIDVKDMNGNVVAYIYHDSDASTFYLYDTDKTTLISQTDPGERTMRDAEDLILTLNGSSYYAEQGTASDEFIMNYDKMNAARESAATFVNTILNANPNSRIALVQFANDEVKTASETAATEAWQADDANYYQINSRVICDYTSDRSKLLTLISNEVDASSNEADASENRYAQEGAGSGYYRYGPSVEEIEANDLETKALASGLVLSNKGGTNYGLAFQYAEEAANRDIGNANANERQIVVFMTDGEPNYLNLGTNSFFPNGQDEYLNNMRDATGSKDSPSWSYFALRTQLQDRLDLEKLGYEIISVGFDLDSDGTGYFAPYYKSAVDDNDNLIEGEPVYSLDINEKTYDFDTSLWEDLGVDRTTDVYDLLIEMRKRVVRDIASYEDGYYAVDKYNADGTPDYSALNVAYEDVANSMIFKTTDAVVTDVIGEDYELRLLPFNNNGTAENPQIVITSADIKINNTYTDSEGNVTRYDTELDEDSTQVIETITFTGTTLSGGISVVDRYLDEEGNWKENTDTFDSLPYTITGHYVTYDSSTKTFNWTIGDIVNQHFELSYDAYLTGSDPAYEQAMGRTDAEWKTDGSDTAFEKAAAAQTLATNEEATILYKNYNNQYCKQTYNVPKLDWQTTSVTVQKAWESTNGLYGNLPEYVTVQLQKSVNGGPWQNVYNPQRVAADSWSYTWYDLPETENGYVIDYTVVETDVSDAFTSEVSEVSEVTEETTNSITITITNTLRETQLTVEKVWDDDENRDGVRPDSVTVYLLNNGEQYGEAVTLNDYKSWKHTWSNLPEYVNKVATSFTVSEAAITDENGKVIYEADISGSEADGYVIKNSHTPETVDVPVIKVWQDNNDQDNIRPDSIEIVLSGTDGSVRTVTLPQNGSWSYTFEDLPKYAEGQVGQLITYTASEPEVPDGYTASYSDDKLTIYNTHATDKTSVTATKIWDDNNDQDGLRQDITLQLMNGSTPVDDPVTIRKADYPNTSSWQVTWSNLEKNQNGNPIVYTVRELGTMEGYETTYSADGLTITNTHTPYTVNYTVTKEWVDEGNRDGARPSTITLWLYANDSFYKEQSFSGSGDSWTCTFENLPQRANGVDIVYTVKEVPIAGYKSVVSDNKITNTHEIDTVNIPVTKLWNDAENQDGKRPDSVQLKLSGSDGSEYFVTLPQNGAWNYTFTGLPKHVAGQVGQAITYTVSEPTVPDGYTVSYDQDSYTVINTHTPITTSVSAHKIWDDGNNQDGLREPVTIQLLATTTKGGTEIVDTVEVSAEGDADMSWAGLPMYKGGEEITYTINEVTELDGYDAIYSEDKLTVTNKHTPATVTISGTKTWDDNNDQDGKRPGSVTVYVMNGDIQVKSATATAENGWTYTFTDLPKYSNGSPITYTVRESAVEGYETPVYDGYNITNKRTPDTVTISGTKTWDDNNNQDGKRPGSITVYLMNGSTQVKSATATAENGWTYTFTDLPKYSNGSLINYTIIEDAVDGYEAPVYDGYNITNKRTTEKIDVTVNKIWSDNNNQDGIRPGSVTLNLLANGDKVDSVTLTKDNLTAQNTWSYTFERLDKYADGEEISYTVSEETVANYTPSYNGLTVTNSYTPGVTSITVKKLWANDSGYESERPQSVTVNLLADGVQKDSVQLTAADGWTHTFTDLPEKNNGSTIAYTISEVTVDRYDTTYNGYEITNTLRRHDVTVYYEDTKENRIADTLTPYDNQPEGTQYNVLNVGDDVDYKPATIVFEGNTYVYTEIKSGSDDESGELDGDKEITYVYTLFNDPAITKTEDKDVLRDGEIITYTLTVTNPSSFDLLNVVVRDVLPAGLEFVDENGNALPDEDGVWTIDRVPARSGDVDGSYTITFYAKVTDRSKAIYTNVGYIDSVVIDADGDDTVDPTDPVKNYNTDPDSTEDDNVSNEVEADVVYDLTVEYRAYDTTAENNYGTKIDTDYTSLNNPNGSSYDVTGEETMPEIIITESGEVWAKKLVSEVDDDPTGIFDDDKKVVVLYEKFDGLYTMYKQVSTDQINWVDEVTVLPGTQVWFRIVVQNLVPYTVTGLDLSDALAFNSAATALPEGWQDIVDTFPSELTANEIWNSPAMAMTAAGVGGNNYVNTATVTNTDPSIPDQSDEAKVNIVSAGALTLTKTADVTAAQDGVKYVAPGAKVPFVVVVTNNGGSELKDVVVVDNSYDVIIKDAQGNETEITKGDTIMTIATLASGESKEITVYIEVSANANNGDQLTNCATATGKDSAGNDVPEATDTDTVVVRCYTVTVNYEDTEGNRIDTSLTPYVNQPENTPYDVTNVGDDVDYKPATIVYEGNTYVYTEIKSGSDDEAGELDDNKEITYVYDLYTDPEIEKDQNKDILRDGDIITYTLTVTNPNSFDLLDVVVRDTLPEGLTFVSNNGQLADSDGTTHTWTISRIPARADGVDGSYEITVSAKVTDRSKAIYTNVGYIDSAIIDADGDDTVDPTDPVKNYNTDPDSEADDNVSNEVEADVVYDLTVEYRAYDTTAQNNYGTKIDTDYTSLNNPNGSSYDVTGEETMPEIIITESGEVWAKKLVSEADDAPTGIFDDDKKVVVLYEKFDGLYTMYKQVSTDQINWVDEVTVLPGTQVWFRIVVQNLVPYTVTGLDLSDALAFNSAATALPEGWQDIVDTFPSELTANEIWNSPAMAMTAAGVGGDNYVNTANVTNTDPSVPDLTDSAKVNIVSAGALTLTKTADVTAAQDGVKYVAPGSTVPFVIVVTNNGGSELKDVEVVDNTHDVIIKDAQGNETEIAKGAPITTIASLASGESKEITVYIEVSANANNGDQLTNRATATGKDSAGNDVSEATDTDTVVVKCYTVTVYYEDTEDNPIADTLTPYVNQPENTPYDVTNVGDDVDYKPATIVYEGSTYVYTGIKDGSSPEKGELDDNKEITYVYTLYVAPEITKTVSDALVDITDGGKNITYTVKVTNNSDLDMTNVKVTDEIPAGLTFVSSETGSHSGGVVTWTIDKIEAGKDATVTFVAAISGDTTTYTYTNTAQVEELTAGGQPVDYTEDPIQSDPVVTEVYKKPAIVKKLDKTLVHITENPGQTDYDITYTLEVTNPNGFALTDVLVSDAIPVGLTFVSAQNGGSLNEGKVEWTIGTIAAGGNAQVSFTARISDADAQNGVALGDTDPYTNIGKITGMTVDPDGDGKNTTDVPLDISSNQVKTYTYKDPTIVKSRDKDLIHITDESGNTNYDITYTLEVTNPNDFALTDVLVSDEVPAGLTFVSAQEGGSLKDGAVEWTIGTIPAGGTEMVHFTARISDADTQKGIALGDTAPYTNIGKITGMTVDPDADGKDETDVALDIPSNPVVTDVYKDPTIVKTVDKDRASKGETVTYTVTVTNEGRVPIYKLTVTDTLPEGMEFDSVQIDENNKASAKIQVSAVPGEFAEAYPNEKAQLTISGTILTAEIPAMAAGATAQITIYAKITDEQYINYVNEAVLEDAYLSYTDDESYIEEMEDTAQTDIVSEPYITKTVDKAVALEGEELLYTITVSNPNAEDITDAVVTDAIPAGLTFVSAQGGTHNNGTITWTIPSIPSGESRSVTFVARVSDVDNYDEYVNTAYLRSVEMDTNGDDVPDHVEYTDKKDSAETLPLRDPTITKTQNRDTLRNGEIITYTLTVFNPNSCDLLNVLVRDPLPAGLTYVDEDGNEADSEGGTLNFTVGYIPAGESRTITFDAKVTDHSEAIYTNVGYIDSAVADIDDNGTADTTDEQLEYNTDPDSTEDDNVSNEVKADVVYDLTVEYRVYDNTAQNNHGEKIEDDYTSLNNPNGSAYDVTGEETMPEIIITETGDIYVRKVVSEAADRPAGTFDDDKTVVVLYEKYDGLYTMYKQVSTDQTNWVDEVTVYPDTTVYFRIVVENLVPYTITGLDLTDALSFNAADGYLPDNWTSVIEAFPSELTANQVWISPAMTLTAAGVGGDSYVNTATVTNTDQTIPDLTDSAKVNIVTPGQIQLTKSANVAPDENGAKYVKVGSLVSFTITVKNVGGTELKNVVVTDDSHDVIVKDADGNETRYGKGTPIATISSLAVNEEKSIDVYIEVSDTMAAGQQLTNQATAAGQDPTGSEVTDSDDDTVTVAAALEPVLSIVKKVNNTDARETPLVVAPGQTLTYTVTVTNNSAVDAKGVYVADYMHVGGEKLTEDWAIDKGWTIDVPAGQSVTIQDEVFVMEMPIGQAGTVLNNVALLYTDEKSYTDGKDPIDDDLAMVETDAVYELEVVKVAQTATVEPGDTAGYIITVTNKSNADLTNVKVSDSLNGTWGQLPVKTAAEEKVSVVKNEDNTLTIDALKAGDSIRFEYSCDVDEDIEEDTVTNTATAESETPDGKLTDSSDAVVTVFRNSLKVVKTASVDTASAGDTVRFIITVTNTGKGELKNVVVTDDLDVTVVAEATSDAEGNVTDSQTPSAALLAELEVDQDDYENKIIGFFETLAAGESKTILVDYVIPEDAEAEEIITNTADATADGGHEATDDDSVEVVDNRVYEYKLNVVKTANVTVADPGDTVTYTIVVTNTGDAELTNVTISDSLPVLYDGKSIMANQTLITIPSLAPNESKSITVTYPISANQTSKTLTNTAKADSDQTEPVESQVTITVAQPEVKVTKTANSQQVVAGNKVYYTITVTNTGNVKLTNLEVKDASVGYSYVIPELDVGKSWVSEYGDLYYTFGASAAVGSSFTNNASVGNEKVKGATNTTTTVTQNPNDYKGPDTGDITVSGQSADRGNTAWSFAASSAILAVVAAAVIIRRKRSRTA